MEPLVGLTTWTHFLPRERVFDRVQVLGELYARAIRAAGGIPVLVPSSLDPIASEGLIERLDGIVLTGGGDPDPRHWGAEPEPGMGAVDPGRDELELSLARRALERDRPVLGICRGIQLLNVAFGGTVIQDLGSAGIAGLVQHDVVSLLDGPGHSIRIEPGTGLAGLAATKAATVTSSHHQAVGRVAKGFVVSARAPDGVIEAIERPDRRFVLGVQWHPERTAGRDPLSDAIFAAFVATAKEAR